MDFYTKTGNHLINQDYCYIKNNIAVISDGCSSVPDTDIGARILTHEYLRNRNINSALDYSLAKITLTFNLPWDALHATLGCIEEQEKEISLKLWGDGYIVYKYKNGSTVTCTVLQNIPFYPLYYKVYKYDKLLTLFPSLKEKDYELYSPQLSLSLEKEKLDFALIFTDGINSCDISHLSLIEEITSFKNINGEFLKRRMNKIMHKYNNTDDLSVIGWSNV